LSESDSPHSRWSPTDRRSHAERRGGPERRSTPAGPPSAHQIGGLPGGERRTGRDRRCGAEAPPSLPFEASVLTGFAPEQGLLDAARAARECAQAPYSRFKVGAALETMNGTIVAGCNIESATYGLTLCAERVALVKALSDGHTAFARLAVVADTALATPPCGACRQLLWEYCGDIDVFLGSLRGLTGHYRLRSLLPLPFDGRLLE
jgi:cytidine deaminase